MAPPRSRFWPDFLTQVSAGRIPDVSGVEVFGRKVDMDVLDTYPQDVICRGTGTYSGFIPEADAGTIDVVSDNAFDTAAGSGVRTVRLSGLDAAWAEQTEDVTMNGLTAVTTTKSWVRCNKMEALTAGSNGTNVGNLTASLTSDSGVEFVGMNADIGASLCAAWTVPAGHEALVVDIYMIGTTASGGGSHLSAGVVTVEGADATDAAATTIRAFGLVTGGATSRPGRLAAGPLPEKTDVVVRVFDVSDDNSECTAELQLIYWPT